jgi:hypothetical protein
MARIVTRGDFQRQINRLTQENRRLRAVLIDIAETASEQVEDDPQNNEAYEDEEDLEEDEEE